MKEIALVLRAVSVGAILILNWLARFSRKMWGRDEL